jgi:multiple sugar transport system permease protein
MSAATTAVGSHRQKDWPKHAIIWAFILVELLPLYMMLQMSFKDNRSFIQNPWLPLGRGAARRLAVGELGLWVKLIGPYIANTVFVAVSGTVGAIFLAILGAYFFARYKMPFSGVLWSGFLVC